MNDTSPGRISGTSTSVSLEVGKSYVTYGGWRAEVLGMKPGGARLPRETLRPSVGGRQGPRGVSFRQRKAVLWRLQQVLWPQHLRYRR